MRSRALRLSLLFLGTLVLIAIPVYFALRQLQRPPISPPDLPRGWAVGQWHRTLDKGSRQSLSNLDTDPPPPIEIELKGPPLSADPAKKARPSELTVSVGAPLPRGQDYLFEIFEASPNLEATLPTGGRLKLEAVAIHLPQDGNWSESDRPRRHPEWLHPLTSAPLTAEEVPGLTREESVDGAAPRLFFRVGYEGELPLRWHLPSVFDERTQLELGGSRSYHGDARHGAFSIKLTAWHRTPILIVCDFAFGAPATRTLSLENGASTAFGRNAEVRLLGIYPHGWTSVATDSRFDGKTEISRTVFALSSGPQRHPHTGLVFYIWPDHARSMIDFRVTPSAHYRGASGSRVTGISLRGDQARAPEIEARYLPRLGRVVFRLPGLPRLPESDNLFTTPIALLRLGHAREMHDLIQKSTGLQWDLSPPSVSNTPFPLVYEDTTPAELLLELEHLSGKRIYYNRQHLSLTDQPPDSLLRKLADWWQRSKPGGFP